MMLDNWVYPKDFFNKSPVNILLTWITKSITLKQEYDMSLALSTIDQGFMRDFQTHWIKEEYNLAILSEYHMEPPNIAKMIQLFSVETWYLILTSTLIISIFNTFYSHLIS